MPSIKIAFITRNKGKFREAYMVARPFGVILVQEPAEKVEIQSTRLEEISLWAAREAYKALGKPLVVEDSGLFVEALNGFPGPYSSYAYETIGLRGLLKLLEGEENRRACFRAAVALATGCHEEVFVGEVCGFISREPRGSSGFGFDPIFVPEGSDSTFAEMGVEEKNRYSHRARAFALMAKRVSSLPSIIECR
ncbi:MAG: XTP/dITP diphosphatase [Desulfurococcales archaeon]|nr:XTP/dITP diphosphatase [Desulfurococcales archaeon]